MASTKNGIIYPDNYDKVADVPADMKALAESVDGNIERINKNLDKNADELKNLQKDNTGNKTAIETLQNDISLIKQNNSEQDKRIQNNTSKIETINKSIEAINKKNTEQDTNLQKNVKDIEANQNNIKALQVENAEVKAENERLRSDIESISLLGEAEGESIDLDDSSGARFKKFGVGGNHSQETREGYNLLDMRNAKGGTSNGITCEINADGSVKYTGTATSNAINVFFLGAYGENAATLFTLKPGTYYIKDVNLYNKTIGINPTKNKYIWTIEEETNVTAVRAPQADTGKTYNETIYPIVSLSNKAVDYEQYGATPSLDFTSEIKAVGSNINLFDKNNMNIIDGAFINSSTKKIEANVNRKCFYIKIKPNEAYTISRKKVASMFAAATTNEIPTIDSDILDINYNNQEEFTITASSNANYLVCYYKTKASDDESEIVDKIKIEKGIVASSYSEYGKGCVDVVVCNKNKLKLTEISEIPGISVSKNNGKLVLNGTATSTNDGIKIGKFYAKKDKTYILSITNKISGFGVNLNNNKVGINENLINIVKSSTAKVSKAATATDNGKVDVYIAINKDTVFNNFEVEIQIEENTTATSIIEHQEQAITMPVQQEMLKEDYFDFENEKQSNLFEKIVLNGVDKKCTTSKAIGDGSEFQWAFTVAQSLPYVRTVYSNVAKLASDFGTVNGIRISANSTTAYVRSKIEVLNGKEATVENVNELLKTMYDNGNPAIFYIEKASNKELDFTDEQKAVAKKIKETLHTYKNITHIYSTDETSPIMNVEYAKDLNTQNNNLQNQIDEIKQLISTTQTSAMLLDNLQKEVESEVE